MEHDKKNVNQNKDKQTSGKQMGDENTRQPNQPFEGGNRNIGQEQGDTKKKPGDRNLDTERGIGSDKDRGTDNLGDI